MERRHAKGPSLALGILGSLGGGTAGAVPFSAIFGTLLGGSGAILGALAGSVGTSFGEVGSLGLADVSGWLFNSVSGDLISSVWGSIGSSLGSAGSVSSSFLPSSPAIFIVPDSAINSGVNSLNSGSLGPIINSLINLF